MIDDHLPVTEVAVIPRRGPQPPGLLELRNAVDEVLLVEVRRLAAVDGVDDATIEVDAEHVVASRRVLHGQGQPDVAQPDDRDPHRITRSRA